MLNAPFVIVKFSARRALELFHAYNVVRKMDVEKYLRRIGIGDEKFAANEESLRRLHRAHLLSVPFENLDIHWKRRIVLDTTEFYKKIVDDERGGFCYELNGLFNELLAAIGFKTRLISARVFNGTTYGPEFDHAAIVVDGDGEEFLADVGFGAFTAEPLRFELGTEQSDPCGTFFIRKFADDGFEVVQKTDGGKKPQYLFRDIERDLSDFAAMCDFQQTSPESHFTQNKLCSILTENGRKTLTDKKFIVTVGDERSEMPVDSEEEFQAILMGAFNISRS